MNIDLARQMIRTAFASGNLLQALLPVLKQQCTPDEYGRWAHAIAVAIDSTNTALISAATEKYPELNEEIEASILAHGSYK